MKRWQRRVEISAILPVFNQAALVGRAVESALAQSRPPDEIVVVDDGSTDGTPEVLERFGDHVRVVRQPNAGAYAARNRAIREAQGGWLAFLDADDVWMPEKLERQVALMARDPTVGLVFADGWILEAKAPNLRRRFFEQGGGPSRGWVIRDLLRANFVPQSSVLCRKDCFERTGPFLELGLSADYHKWLQVALHYRFDYVDEPLIEYHILGSNISLDRPRQYRSNLFVIQDILTSLVEPEDRRIALERKFELRCELGMVLVRGGLLELARALGEKESGLGPARRVARMIGLGVFHLLDRIRRRGVRLLSVVRGSPRGSAPPLTGDLALSSSKDSVNDSRP